MMRRADLLESVPGGVMQHWKNDGYSDDWIITQVAHRQKRRITNPPLLFLNLVEFSTLRQVYNFLHRQFFVLDTYVQPPPGESRLPWVDPHRRESYLLSLAMASGGSLFAIGESRQFSPESYGPRVAAALGNVPSSQSGGRSLPHHATSSPNAAISYPPLTSPLSCVCKSALQKAAATLASSLAQTPHSHPTTHPSASRKRNSP